MILVIGLGNPGTQYQNTRHNAGFMAVEHLASHYGCTFSKKSKFSADIASGAGVGGASSKVLFVKPLAYMNLSGASVNQIKTYYHVKLEDIYVIHDDIDLGVGRIKVKHGGGSGGHNGLNSLDQHLGSNYHRIRIGVGRPERGVEVSDYVLSSFLGPERAVIQNSVQTIADNFDLLLAGKVAEFRAKCSLGDKN